MLPLSIHNFKQHLSNLKKPYLQSISQATNQFHQKVISFQNNISPPSNPPSQPSSILSNQPINPPIRSNPPPQQHQQPHMSFSSLKQWQPNLSNNFEDYDDVSKEYENIFERKLPRRSKYKNVYDFRKEQLDMLHRIYLEITKQPHQTVNFTSIQEFFNNYTLFYSYYNIHPKNIRSILKQFARTYSNMLTENEFIKMMLNDRPILVGYELFHDKNSQIKCTLTEQSWTHLKSIFNTLDTFGNQIINLSQFIYRIKNNLSNRQLLNTYAIEYPEINRKHSLNKIIFNLQYKYQYDQKITWSTIKAFIKQFRCKQQPSIDVIYKCQIQNGNISKESNYFYLHQEVLDIIKDIFKRCPKYCLHFVSKKFIIEQLLQSPQIKKHLGLAVRKNHKGQYINLQATIKSIIRTGYQYLDLDQILDHFSIRGPPRIDFQQFYRIFNEDESEEEQIQQSIRKKKLNKIKSLNNINSPKVRTQSCEPFRKIIHYTTIPQQFNFYVKNQPNTRCQRVYEMIQQKQNQQMQQLKKKFKANPIPTTNNQQIYRSYQRRMKKKKQQILQQFNRNNQNAKSIVDYLKSNTKIFQPKKIVQTQPFLRNSPKFQAKTIPWFVENNILAHIQAQKNHKRQQILQETKKRHNKYKMNQNIPYNPNYQTHQSLISIIPNQSQKNQYIKPKPIPNFQLLHKKFENELKEKKINKKVTQINAFKFHQPRNKKQKQQQNHKIQLFRSLSPKSRSYNIQSKQISSTKKIKAWFAATKAKIKKKSQQKQIIKKQIQRRKQKQKNFAKFMRQKLKVVSQHKLAKLKSLQKFEKLKKIQQELQIAHNRQLSQIYQRVYQRPFLFQQNYHQQQKKHQKLNEKSSQYYLRHDKKQKQYINHQNQQENQSLSEQPLNKSSDI